MWMTRQLETIRPDASIVDAAVTMARLGVRRLPVVDGDGAGRLVGIVTSHDVARAFPPEVNPFSTMADRFEDARPVSEIMSRTLHVTTPDTPIEEAARLLRHYKVGALPVVVRGGVLAGIVTESDVFQALLEMIGVQTEGVTITFDVGSGEDVLGIAQSVACEQGLRVASVLSFRHEHRTFGGERRYAVVRLTGPNCAAAAEAVWRSGHRVMSVQHTGPEPVPLELEAAP